MKYRYCWTQQFRLREASEFIGASSSEPHRPLAALAFPSGRAPGIERTPVWTQTYSLRCHTLESKKVEMRFAHMKRIFKLDRLRLRGLSGAKDEVLLTATAQNLRRLVKFLSRPPPSPAILCAA